METLLIVLVIILVGIYLLIVVARFCHMLLQLLFTGESDYNIIDIFKTNFFNIL